MPVDYRLSGAMVTRMENSTKTQTSAVTLSDRAKKAITSPPSAGPWRPDESKPLNEPDAAAVLTGSLNDLTLKGHFSDEKPAERILSPREKAKEDNVCVNCLRPAASRCSRCNSSWYCSSRCQRADRIYHKYLCSQVTEHKNPPGPDHVRAILFPDSEKSPKFIWLKTNDRTLDLDKLDEKLEVAHVLGFEGGSQIGQQQVTLTKDTRRQSTPGLQGNAEPHLLLREDCFVDGSKPNLSIGTVTSGKFQFSWRGPIVAVMVAPEESDITGASPVLIDITITDYRDLIDFFRSYGQYEEGVEDFAPISFWWLAPALKQELISQPQFQVVRLSCDSEYEATKNKYGSFSIGVGHPAMAFLRPCPVTTHIGIPLLFRRSPTDDAYKADAEATGNTNYGPNLLLMNVDPESDNWGRVPENCTQGTVVVMREDSLDLYPHHLEAILTYLKELVLPALRDSTGPNPERTRPSVFEMLTSERFFIYYTRYKMVKRDIDQTWKSTPDPKGYSSGAR